MKKRNFLKRRVRNQAAAVQKKAESKLETVFSCSGVKVFTYFVKLINFKILAPEHENTRTLEHSNTRTLEDSKTRTPYKGLPGKFR